MPGEQITMSVFRDYVEIRDDKIGRLGKLVSRVLKILDIKYIFSPEFVFKFGNQFENPVVPLENLLEPLKQLSELGQIGGLLTAEKSGYFAEDSQANLTLASFYTVTSVINL